MIRCSQRTLTGAGLAVAGIDHFAPHQANIRMIEAMASRLALPPGRVLTSIADYGNSSAATIPLTLSLANAAKPFRAGQSILMTAAGAGLTAGAAVVRL
jgi:3-oxoacyl-[acyl-carrier-protein] synthase-3